MTIEIFDGMFLQIFAPLTSDSSTTDGSVVCEGYVRTSDLENPRKIDLDSPSIGDLRNKTSDGEYSGRTDEQIVDNLNEWANYIVEGTMSEGAELGTLTQAGRKLLKTRINAHAEHDKFIWVIIPDDGQGLLNYNDGTVDSGQTWSQTSIYHFKGKKIRTVVNQVNLKGALGADGVPLKYTANNIPLQLIYGILPVFRTFANLNTKALVITQAESMLSLEENAPYSYTFTRAIGAEGLVLPSETVNITYAPKSVAAGDRIIKSVYLHFRAGIAKYTVVDAIIYTSEMDILRKEVEENTDLIEQLGKLITSAAGGLRLYLQLGASADIATYKIMCVDYPEGAKTAVVNGVTVTADAQLLISFATPSGCPGVTELIEGIAGLRLTGYKPSGTKDIRIYANIYKRVLAGTETLLGTTQESNYLADAEAQIRVFADIDAVNLLTTDRIVLKIYANLEGGGVNPTITLYADNDTLARLTLPVSAIQASSISKIDAIFSRLETQGTNKWYFGSGGLNYEVVGTSGTDIDWVDAATLYNGAAEIIAEWQDHKNILRLQDDATAAEDPQINHNITQATSGTFEFYIGTDDVTERKDVTLREEGEGLIIWFSIQQSKLRYYSSLGAWVDILDPAVDDTLYHIKIVWRADNTFDLYLNGVKEVDNQITADTQVSGIDQIQVVCFGDNTDYCYFDAPGLVGEVDPKGFTYKMGTNE